MNDTIALRGRRGANGRCVEYVRPLNATGECSQMVTFSTSSNSIHTDVLQLRV